MAIVGAGGYVGRHLTQRLVGAGGRVVALGRNPSHLPSGSGIQRRPVDVGNPAAAAAALAGVSTAYYLVHSLASGSGFAGRDRALARSFGQAAAAAGVGRIVYLGGLGTGALSEHLASRQEVGRMLAESGVPVVELRAAVILGAGSISFEMLRNLTERLPVMVCPRWVSTRVQPLAERDLLSYLEQAATVPPGVYEIGGADASTYGEMMKLYAQVRGLHPRRILTVPLLTPSLSARWVDLVTPVDVTISHALIRSLVSDVVVRHPERTAAVFSVAPLGLAESLRAALDEQAARVPGTLLDLPSGQRDGIFAMRCTVPVASGQVAEARAELARVGGDLTWYGLATAWRIRLVLGWLLGERLHLHHPESLTQGSTADWWTVEEVSQDTLVLGTKAWGCGEAWLGCWLTDEADAAVTQVAALRPKGLTGLVYWLALWPFHQVIFTLMARHRALSRPKLGHTLRRRLGALGIPVVPANE